MSLGKSFAKSQEEKLQKVKKFLEETLEALQLKGILTEEQISELFIETVDSSYKVPNPRVYLSRHEVIIDKLQLSSKRIMLLHTEKISMEEVVAHNRKHALINYYTKKNTFNMLVGATFSKALNRIQEERKENAESD